MNYLLNKCFFAKEGEHTANSSTFDLNKLNELYVLNNKAKLIPAGKYVSVSVKEGYQGDVGLLPCGARSLLVHPETEVIHARGINKFFSLSELLMKGDLPAEWINDRTLWKESECRFEIYVQRKMAGFAVSLFSDDGEQLSIMSKHCVDGQHVEIAKRVFYASTSAAQRQVMAHCLHALNATASCECISLAEDYLHPVLEEEQFNNRLVLFSIQLNQLSEKCLNPIFLKEIAILWGLECVPQLHVRSQKELESIISAVSGRWNPTISFEESDGQATLQPSDDNHIGMSHRERGTLAEGVVIVFAEKVPDIPYESQDGNRVGGQTANRTMKDNSNANCMTPSDSLTISLCAPSILSLFLRPHCWMRLIRLKVKTCRYICMRNFRSLLKRESRCRSFLMHYILLEWALGKYSASPAVRSEEEVQEVINRSGVQTLYNAFFSYIFRNARITYRDAVCSVGLEVEHLINVTVREANQDCYAPITFLILCGLPGSGKSTFAKALLQDLVSRGSCSFSVGVHISRDRIYRKITDEIFGACDSNNPPSKHQLRRVEQKVHTEVVLSLQRVTQLSMLSDLPVFVVLDACNSTPAARNFWRGVLPKFIDYSAVVHIYCSDRSELENRLHQRVFHERLGDAETAQRALYTVEKKFIPPPSSPSQVVLEDCDFRVYHFDTVWTSSRKRTSNSCFDFSISEKEKMKNLCDEILEYHPPPWSCAQRPNKADRKARRVDRDTMIITDEKGVLDEIHTITTSICTSLLNIGDFSSKTLSLLPSFILPSSFKASKAFSSPSAWSVHLELSMTCSDLQSLGAQILSPYVKEKQAKIAGGTEDQVEEASAVRSSSFFRSLFPCHFLTKLRENVSELWKEKREGKKLPDVLPSTICSGQPYWLPGWLNLANRCVAQVNEFALSTTDTRESNGALKSDDPDQKGEFQIKQLGVYPFFSLLRSSLSSRFSETPALPHVTLYYSHQEKKPRDVNGFHDHHDAHPFPRREILMANFLKTYDLYRGKVIKGEITDLLVDRHAWAFKIRLFCKTDVEIQSSEINSPTAWLSQLVYAPPEGEAEKKANNSGEKKHVPIPLHITVGVVPGIPFSYVGEMFSKFEEWDRENTKLALSQKSLSATRSRQKYHNFLQVHLSSPFPFSGTINSYGC